MVTSLCAKSHIVLDPGSELECSRTLVAAVHVPPMAASNYVRDDKMNTDLPFVGAHNYAPSVKVTDSWSFGTDCILIAETTVKIMVVEYVSGDYWMWLIIAFSGSPGLVKSNLWKDDSLRDDSLILFWLKR